MTITERFRAWMRRMVLPDDPSHDRIIYVTKTDAGTRITHDTALTVSGFWAGVRSITDPMSYLSWHVFERDGEGKKRKPELFVDWLLNSQPNDEMSAGTWRETILAHAMTWGNGYAEIERDGSGRPMALWPLPPDRVCPKRDDFGRVYYEVWPSMGQSVPIPARDMFHLKGLGFDGLMGYSVVKLAAQSLGLNLAMEQNSSAFFANGSQPIGGLEYPGKASEETKETTRREWNKAHSGRKRYSVAILDQGLKFTPYSIPNNDSQLIESRKLGVREIARWLHVPPHKLADLEDAHFTNIEEQNIEFVTDALMPWVNRLEQEANIKLFGPGSQGRLFTKMNLKTLLRGNTQAQATFLQLMLDRGVFSVNDALEYLDMNDIGAIGDKRLVPLNMTTLEKAGTEPVAPEPAPQPDRPEEPNQAMDEMAVTNRLNGHAKLILP